MQIKRFVRSALYVVAVGVVYFAAMPRGASCVTCVMDSVATNASLPKCPDFPAYTNSSGDCQQHLYLMQTTATSFTESGSDSGYKTIEEAGVVTPGPYNDFRQYTYNITCVVAITNPQTCQTTNYYSGFMDGYWSNYCGAEIIADGTDHSDGTTFEDTYYGGSGTNWTACSGHFTSSFDVSQGETITDSGRDCDASDPPWSIWTVPGAVNYTPTCKTITVGADDFNDPNYPTASGTTICTLGTEFTDAMLYGNILSIIPVCPTNWAAGNGGLSYSRISADHTSGALQRGGYRFKLLPQTETNTSYLVNWDIVTVYEEGTNTTSSIDGNYSEIISGTGDPSNYVYGVEHDLAAPPFYAPSTNGGLCLRFVDNVTISSPSGGPAGNGPGGLAQDSDDGQTCSSCSSSLGNDGGMEAHFGLGTTVGGQAVGMLRIWSALPATTLARPDGLALVANTNFLTVVDNGSDLRQVLAPQALADIVVLTPFSYNINFYYPTQIVAVVNNMYETTGSSYVSWNIQNPYGTNSTNTIQITETRGGSSWIYNYLYNPTNNSWTYMAPGGLRQMQLITTANPCDGTRVLQSIVGSTNGAITSMLTRTYQQYSWGEGVVQEVRGAGADAKVTTTTYYDNLPSSGTFLPIQQVIHPDGTWEYYKYNSLNLPDGTSAMVTSDVYRPLGDSKANGTSGGSTGNYRHTSYGYSPVDASDNGTQEPYTPRTVVEDINGSPVSGRYVVLSPGQKREMVCGTTIGITEAGNLVTTTIYFTDGPNIFRPKNVLNPDGTMEFYSYAQGTNGWVTNTVTAGRPNASQTGIADGTQTTTILDAFGQKVSVTVLDVLTTKTLQRDVYGDFDALDRAQQVVHLDGTTNFFDYACCYLESTVDRDGLATSYLYDAAKRKYGYQQHFGAENPITYKHTLDAAGRIVQSVRYGTDGSPILQSQSAYNTAGRLIAATNALNGSTTYVETKDPMTGGLIRTTTYPDLSTRVEAYYLDGSLKSVTGTGVHGKTYGYGCENANDIGFSCSYVVATNLNNSGNLTSEWVKTYTDPAGRTVEVLYSGDGYNDANGHYRSGPSSLSYFNAQGQLWKQVDPDCVTTLYTYNAKGERDYTIVAVSSGTQTISDYATLLGSLSGLSGILAGADRVTETTNGVTISHGVNVRRSQTLAWLDGSAIGTPISILETSLEGLTNWQSQYRDNSTVATSTNITSYAGSSRTVINSAPDGSYAINLYSYGRLMSTTRHDASGAQIGGTSFGYDAHGRQSQVTDVRNRTTTYGYSDADQVVMVTTPVPGGGQSAESTTTLYDTRLRPYSVIQPDNNTVNTEYLATGELGMQYGSRTYPVAYSYDYAGRMQTMTTWTNFDSRLGPSVTTWMYDGQRGWLTNKVYADGTGPSYTYTPAGRLQSRAWVRTDASANPISTSYAYDATGSLTNILYSDGTPSVTNSYDRLARLAQQNTANYQMHSTYNLAGELLAESYSSGPLAGLTITNRYDQYLRRTNLAALGANISLFQQTFGYDAASRLQTVNDGHGDNVTYSYLANSPLVSQIVFKQGTGTSMTTTKQYDYLNRLTQISSQPSGTGVPPVSFNYAYNLTNQRTQDKLADGSYWVYQYDALGQVISGTKYFYDGTLVPGQQFDYSFDTIGNRTQSKAGGDQSGGGLRLASYSVNNLNQIMSRDYPGTNDVIGVALATNPVTVNGQPAFHKWEYFRGTVGTNNNTSPAWLTAVVGSGGSSTTGGLFVAQTPEHFSYDPDGNLLSDGRWNYTWDAENRLTAMTNSTSVGPQYQMTFAYDAKGRRMQKTVVSNGVPVSTIKYLYDGWNLVVATNSQASVLESFMWGGDLSGSMQGAGGVGGLLEVSYVGSSTTNCFPAFDGNGNLAALVDAANGTTSANYEYGPFGEVIRQTGPMAKANPFRFSTKYQDDESDLLYYGHRYYKASTGTWVSRDPIQEPGFQTSHWTYLLFANSSDYQFDVNDPVDKYDYIGLKAVSACCAQWKPRWELMYGAAPASGPNKPLAKCLYNKIKELDPELYGMLIKGEVPMDIVVSTALGVTGTAGSVQDICKSGEGPGFLSRFTAAIGTAWSAYSEIDKLNTIGKACDYCSEQACMKFVPKVKVDRAWYSPCRLFGSSTCLVCPQGSDEVSGEPGKPVWRDAPSP